MKVLAHYDWGADQSTLLHLYRALIRSKLDYGCVVYGSASRTYIKQLDTIQNQALRLSLGAFKSSPVTSLHVEANEPPLHFRRQKLILQYGIKLKAYKENPAYPYVFPTDYSYKTRLERRAIPAFRVRFQRLLDSFNIKIDNIADSENVLEFPLWDMPEMLCLSHIANFEKDNTLPQFYQDQFHITRYLYSDYECIYTDGSKRGDQVACACVTPLFTDAQRIPDCSSIFSAESYAVLNALRYIKLNRFSKFIVFTDSLSLIQSIEFRYNKNPIVQSIIQKFYEIVEQKKQVIFCWIPSHVGIRGNERADQAAKQALDLEESKISIPYTDKTPIIKSSILNAWQQHWDINSNNKLHEIKPQLGPSFYVNTGRKDQVVLNRIRIGHTRLTHGFLMEQKNAPQPRCHFCGTNEILTIQHVLIKCPSFSAIRSNYFSVHNMKDLFETIPVNDIIGYLKETSLYQQI